MTEDNMTDYNQAGHCARKTYSSDDDAERWPDITYDVNFAAKQPPYSHLLLHRIVNGLFQRFLILFYIIIGQM